MTTKPIERCGLDLMIVDDTMLQGIETLARMYKAQHDEHNYNFLTQVKTALAKYPNLAKHVAEIAAMNRIIAKSLNDSSDFIEQLFPQPQKK